MQDLYKFPTEACCMINENSNISYSLVAELVFTQTGFTSTIANITIFFIKVLMISEWLLV